VFSSMRKVFFGQSVGEEQRGAAKKQGIGEIVEAVADVGGDGDEDGQVDDQDDEQNCEAEIGCGEAGFFVDKQACAGGEKDCAGEIGPEKMQRNPGGRRFLEGHAGGEVGMQEVLDAEEECGDDHEVAGKSYKGRVGFGRRCAFDLRASESECAAAEGKVSQSDRPRNSVVGVANHLGNME